MQITAIGTVSVTIVLLGAFLYVRDTVASFGSTVLDKIEIKVYMNPDADRPTEDAVRTALASDPRVLEAHFVDKKEGLRKMRDLLRRELDTSLLTSNPLPDAFVVRVRKPDDVPTIAARLQKQRGVATVEYAAGTVTKLLQTAAVLGRIGIGMIALLLATASIIIANTIRLTVFARRREIAIMQLVGATNAYIRGPFIMEGLVAGLAGAVVAIGILAVAQTQVAKIAATLAFVPLHANSGLLALELLGVGAAVGFISSWLSVGRYLRAQ
jgi:cell division transport system permease protein